jgi:hypothetical protein
MLMRQNFRTVNAIADDNSWQLSMNETPLSLRRHSFHSTNPCVDSNAKRNTAIRKNPCNYIEVKADQQHKTADMTAYYTDGDRKLASNKYVQTSPFSIWP